MSQQVDTVIIICCLVLELFNKYLHTSSGEWFLGHQKIKRDLAKIS